MDGSTVPASGRGGGRAQGHPQVCCPSLCKAEDWTFGVLSLRSVGAWGGAHSRGDRHLGWVQVGSSVFVLAGPAQERPNPAPASLEGRDLATQPQQVLSTWTGQTEGQQALRQQPHSESTSTLTFEPKLPTPSLWFHVSFSASGSWFPACILRSGGPVESRYLPELALLSSLVSGCKRVPPKWSPALFLDRKQVSPASLESKGSTPLAPNPTPARIEGSLEAAPSAGGLSPGLSPLPLAQSPTPPLSVHSHLL